MNLPATSEDLIELAHRAGKAILEIYDASEGIEIDRKADDSPLTQADLASDRVILDGLEALAPEVPVLTEETADQVGQERLDWETFFLVDPLDGTKEFIKRNGEFTVNIAVIHQGVPVAGVVHVPAQGTTYWGQADQGAFKVGPDGQAEAIQVRPVQHAQRLRVVVSRSHLNDATQAYLDRLPGHELIPAGSSLKICRVAEGEADLYPRLAPTMEWDTAAGQAVLEAAGGVILQADGHEPLRYNKQDLLNPHFIAGSSHQLVTTA